MIRPRCLTRYENYKLGVMNGEGIFLFETTKQARYLVGECSNQLPEVRTKILPWKDDNLLLLVGYRQQVKKNETFRIWKFNKLTQEIIGPLAYQSHSILTGFGDATIVTNNEEIDSNPFLLLIATGLGKGVARLWTLNLNTLECSILTSFKAKHSTISAILIVKENIITATHYGCIQEWNFQQFLQSSSSTLAQIISGRDAKKTFNSIKQAKEEYSLYEEFIEEFENPEIRPPNLIDYLLEYPEWKDIFPKKSIHPYEYEGEMNEQGLAHGKGTKLIETNQQQWITFNGHWINGIPIFGTIKGSNYTYSGEVKGEFALKHGFGEQETELEIYRGGWKDDQRHGIGYVFSKNSKSKKYGTHEFGFFHEGKAHGLRWHIWEINSLQYPFAFGKEEQAKKEIDTLRCIQLKNNNQLIDEFHFHRLNGIPIFKKEEYLLNVQGKEQFCDTFAKSPPFTKTALKSFRKECWACCQEDEDEEEDKLICCAICNMKVHEECSWPKEMFLKNLLIGKWLCNMCTLMMKKFYIYDRHGEICYIENEQDLIRLQSNSKKKLRVYFDATFSSLTSS